MEGCCGIDTARDCTWVIWGIVGTSGTTLGTGIVDINGIVGINGIGCAWVVDCNGWVWGCGWGCGWGWGVGCGGCWFWGGNGCKRRIFETTWK